MFYLKECGLQAHKWRVSQIRKLKEEGIKLEKKIDYHISACQVCHECSRILSCLAIRRTEVDGLESMQIDEDSCIKCGTCYNICPNRAVRKTIYNAFGVEVLFRES